MKRTINEYQFCRAFDEMNRSENFSYEGRKAIFEYLEQYEEDTGEEIELDVIAICCDFSEYANLAEFQAEYGAEYETLEDIEDATTVIRVDTEDNKDGIEDGSFIIQVF
jgi:hypothetical protein